MSIMNLLDCIMITPFEDHPDASHVSVKDLLNKQIFIYDVAEFENKNGKGVYVLFQFQNDDADAWHTTCTHSSGIMNILSNSKVVEVLEENAIACTVVQKKSQNTGNLYYTLQ